MKRYLRTAEALADSFGEVFGPLPASLVAGDFNPPTNRISPVVSASTNGRANGHLDPHLDPQLLKHVKLQRRGRDSNPPERVDKNFKRYAVLHVNQLKNYGGIIRKRLSAGLRTSTSIDSSRALLGHSMAPAHAIKMVWGRPSRLQLGGTGLHTRRLPCSDSGGVPPAFSGRSRRSRPPSWQHRLPWLLSSSSDVRPLLGSHGAALPAPGWRRRRRGARAEGAHPERGYAGEPLVRPRVVEVAEGILPQHMQQMMLAQDNHVVEALAPHAPEESLAHGIHQGRLHCHLHDPQPRSLGDAIEDCPVLVVAISDQESRGFAERPPTRGKGRLTRRNAGRNTLALRRVTEQRLRTRLFNTSPMWPIRDDRSSLVRREKPGDDWADDTGSHYNPLPAPPGR